MPGALALGAFSFTMDSLPGTPQIQNIIPTTFFKTTSWAAPVLGTIGSLFIIVVGLAYLEWRRRAAMAKGEGYGTSLQNEPNATRKRCRIPRRGAAAGAGGRGQLRVHQDDPGLVRRRRLHRAPEVLPGVHTPVTATIKTVLAIWAVQAALLLGILLVVATAFRRISTRFAGGSKEAVGRRAAGGHEHGVRIRLRRRDRRAAGLHRRRERPEKHPEPAGECRRVGQLAGRHHRVRPRAA
jgi:H+/gluconate symporter-like permease